MLTIGNGERPAKHGICELKDRDVRTDAECEQENDDRRAQGVPPHHTQRKPYVGAYHVYLFARGATDEIDDRAGPDTCKSFDPAVLVSRLPLVLEIL